MVPSLKLSHTHTFLYLYLYIYIYTWNPFVLCFASKRRSFPIKTRDIWVPGINIPWNKTNTSQKETFTFHFHPLIFQGRLLAVSFRCGTPTPGHSGSCRGSWPCGRATLAALALGSLVYFGIRVVQWDFANAISLVNVRDIFGTKHGQLRSGFRILRYLNKLNKVFFQKWLQSKSRVCFI